MDKCRSLPFCRSDLNNCKFASDVDTLIHWIIIGHGEKKEYPIDIHTLLFIRKGGAYIHGVDCICRKLNEGEFVALPKGAVLGVTTDNHASLLLCAIGEEFVMNSYLSLEVLSPTKEKDRVLKINVPLERLLDSLEYNISKGLRCCGYIRVKYNELGYLLGLHYRPEDLLALFYFILDKDALFRYMITKEANKGKSIEELARIAHMTRRGFCKKFTRVFGELPSVWLSQKKAQLIRRELVSTKRPLKDIMYEFNFPSPSSFNYFCLKYFEMPPGKLRSLSSKSEIAEVIN